VLWLNIQLPAQRISQPAPTPHQVQPAPVRKVVRVPAPAPQMRVPRNPRWLTHPAQDSSVFLVHSYIHLRLLTLSVTSPWPSPQGASGPRQPHLNSVLAHFMVGSSYYHEAVELLRAVVDSQ